MKKHLTKEQYEENLKKLMVGELQIRKVKKTTKKSTKKETENV